MASLGSVEWVVLEDVAPGDVVSAEAGGMPIYRVVAIEDDAAWLQDEQHPAPLKMPLACLHWKAAAA